MPYINFLSSGGDPYWNDVLVLLPFDGSGTSITDYGPLANTVTIFNDSGSSTYTQDSSRQLFGKNTLHADHATSTEERSARVNNTLNPISAGSNIVSEGWIYVQSNSNFTSSPVASRFASSITLDAMKYSDSDEWQFTVDFTNDRRSSGVAANGSWYYFAMQYVAADGACYHYFGKEGDANATQLSSVTGLGSIGGANWDFLVTYTGGTGTSTNAYNCWQANYRVTRANRYGNQSSIPMPTAQWPIGL